MTEGLTPREQQLLDVCIAWWKVNGRHPTFEEVAGSVTPKVNPRTVQRWAEPRGWDWYKGAAAREAWPKVCAIAGCPRRPVREGLCRLHWHQRELDDLAVEEERKADEMLRRFSDGWRRPRE